MNLFGANRLHDLFRCGDVWSFFIVVERLHDFFCAHMFWDFFGAKRFRDFFWCQENT